MAAKLKIEFFFINRLLKSAVKIKWLTISEVWLTSDYYKFKRRLRIMTHLYCNLEFYVINCFLNICGILNSRFVRESNWLRCPCSDTVSIIGHTLIRMELHAPFKPYGKSYLLSVERNRLLFTFRLIWSLWSYAEIHFNYCQIIQYNGYLEILPVEDWKDWKVEMSF